VRALSRQVALLITGITASTSTRQSGNSTLDKRHSSNPVCTKQSMLRLPRGGLMLVGAAGRKTPDHIVVLRSTVMPGNARDLALP